MCGLKTLVTTEKNISRLFFLFEVYLTFDKQNDCHSNMCILLNKYLCKYHKRKGVISLCWFTLLQKQINTFYCVLFLLIFVFIKHFSALLLYYEFLPVQYVLGGVVGSDAEDSRLLFAALI